jgi:hypothetical protein
MSSLVTRKFASVEDLNVFLHGGIISGPRFILSTLYGLHNKTLVFNMPAATTVTFVDPTDAGLTLANIVTQIKAGAAALTPRYSERRLVLEYATPGTAVDLDKTGTANEALGFSADEDTAGTFYNAWDGAAPRLLDFAPWGQMDSVAVITEE